MISRPRFINVLSVHLINMPLFEENPGLAYKTSRTTVMVMYIVCYIVEERWLSRGCLQRLRNRGTGISRRQNDWTLCVNT